MCCLEEYTEPENRDYSGVFKLIYVIFAILAAGACALILYKVSGKKTAPSGSGQTDPAVVSVNVTLIKDEYIGSSEEKVPLGAVNT